MHPTGFASISANAEYFADTDPANGTAEVSGKGRVFSFNFFLHTLPQFSWDRIVSVGTGI